MHDSMRRLLQFVRAATRDTAHPVLDFAGIGHRMDKTSAVMTNWKKRGISKDGAIEAERLFGCSARWVLTGGGAAINAALTDEAIQRAALWQQLDQTGRVFFDRTLDLARLAEHHAREVAAPAYGSTVPGDLDPTAVVIGPGGSNPHKKAKRRAKR